MRILWLINFEIPLLGNMKMVKEGWISGMLSAIREYHPDQKIILLYPQNRIGKNELKDIEGLKAIGYYRNWDPTKYNEGLKDIFAEIVKDINPDVIHIMGTELPHTLSMCEACERLSIIDKLIISIQGMMEPIAQMYDYALPFFVRYGCRLVYKRPNSINRDKRKMKKRATYERIALSISKNVIGRTNWDKMYVSLINPNLKYYHNNEVLRDIFYNSEWDYDSCIKNTVFISQADYPIKGLHVLLEAAYMLKQRGYNLQYRIAGNNIIESQNCDRYFEYIRMLLSKFSLMDNFKFLGFIDEEAMVTEYKRANIYVLPSLIENSPNSLGEAMIMGMPVISSDVGGIKDFISHGENGYIFPLSEPYMLAYYVEELLNDKDKAINFGRNAMKTAYKLYNRKKNADYLLEIYDDLNAS